VTTNNDQLSDEKTKFKKQKKKVVEPRPFKRTLNVSSVSSKNLI
jgi:hypothetical protein